MQCSERLLSHSQILYSAKSSKEQAPYSRFQLASKSNRKNSFLQLGLLIRFQHALDQTGEVTRVEGGEGKCGEKEEKKEREKEYGQGQERSRKGSRSRNKS